MGFTQSLLGQIAKAIDPPPRVLQPLSLPRATAPRLVTLTATTGSAKRAATIGTGHKK